MKRRHQVIVAPRAVGQLDRIVQWWQANRAEAPDLFADEFAAALTRLAKYYVATDPGGRVVVVLAVWPAARGGRPRL